MMELSEAKEILKEFYKRTKIDDSKIRLALFSVMYYIEKESIPKEKVRELLEIIENDLELSMRNEYEAVSIELQFLLEKVQEILGDD